MIRFEARALLLFAACLSLPATAFAVGTGDMERLGASVFRIEARASHGSLSSGSGVMVAGQTLVTNCHVVMHSQDIGVISPAGRFPARVARAHIERDLCLLDVPGLQGSAVILGNTADKQAGEPITAVGYAAGEPLTRSRGHIEGLFSYDGAARVVQGSAAFNAGKSGGGLFDKDGRLIGILTFKCRAGGPYHFAVPAEWVEALMRDDSGASRALAEKPFWQHTGEKQPVFVRAASLAATGDCMTLAVLASQWLAREPRNPEALAMVSHAQRCNARAMIDVAKMNAGG